MVLFIMLYKVVLISKSLDETLVRDHSKLFIKLYKVVLIFKSVEDTQLLCGWPFK